jgi:hypothetical protein
MKVYRVIMITTMMITNITTATEPKPSAWDKLKGIFTKKKPTEPLPGQKVNPKEFAQQMLDKTNKILDSNKPQPTLTQSAQQAISKITALKSAIQKFLKQCSADTDMIKIKIKTVDVVKNELQKAKTKADHFRKSPDALTNENLALVKKRNELKKKIEELAKKGISDTKEQMQQELFTVTQDIEKVKQKAFDTQAQLENQLGRLRADLLSTLIDVPKNAKPIIKAIQDIVVLADKDKAKNTFEPLMKVCDELLKKGDAIVDQLMLKHNAYGTMSSSVPERQDVMINTYVKSVLDLSNKIQSLTQTFESAINKLNTIMTGANILSMGSLTPVKIFTATLAKATKSFSLAAELAKDIASVTVSQVNQEVSNAEAEIKKNEKELANVN